MVLPPTVVGFGLLLFFGRHGPVSWVFPGQVLFTWWAAVIASAVMAFPLVYQNASAAFAQVDPDQENAARTLGAGEIRVFFTVTIPLAWPGILSGLVLAFARALGEFGATLMVAGNIPGKTQTVPMAIYFAVEAGDYRTAVPLVFTVLVLSFTLIFGLHRWSRRQLTRYAEQRRC
ncbi:molybdate ABC transporter permease subunit, partial [Calderihabitans maritimus]